MFQHLHLCGVSHRQLYLICATFLICLAQILHLTAAQSYSIIAPNTLRPNSSYHVSVSLHQSDKRARIKLGIFGSTYSDFKLVEVQPHSSQNVHFAIPAIKPDRYRLTAEGVSGISFRNETTLHFDAKRFSVLIQTDKSIYKPTDLVQYRFLIVDPNLKPAADFEQVNVQLLDAGQNLIKSYKNLRLLNGIYTNEVQLSDYPKLGEWSINVDIDGYKYKKTFEVLEYILPKFVVDIDTDKHVIYRDGKIRATIKSYYAFGKPIVGEATLSIYPTFFGSLQPFVNDLITRKVLPINGNAYFEFDIKNDLKLKEDYEHEYLFDALVEESTTGSVQNFSRVITVHLDTYRVETVKIPANYVPGVSFEVTIKVVRNDGGMLKNFPHEISAYLTNVYGSSEMYNTTTYTLNAAGEVQMKFTVPVGDNDEYHSVIVDYLGITTDVGRVPRKHLHSKNYISANMMTEKAIINKDIVIAVHSNIPISNFMYQIVARGDIIATQTIVAESKNYHTFKFMATFEMVPRATILIYRVTDGEFVYDELVIPFEPTLLNSIKVEAPIKAPPGQEIDIKINTKPHSIVGLMIVDQNAANLKEGNDLSVETLMDALSSFELSDVNTPMGSPGRLSGVVTMSNTNYFIEKEEETIPLLERAALEEDDRMTKLRKTDIGPAHKFEVNTLAPGKGRYAFSYTPKPYWHNPRVHLMHNPADTWLFTNLSAGADGQSTLQKQIPSHLTSWTISAFSLNAVLGLGLSRPTNVLQSYREFYITTELPYSIRKGEVIALPFVVFNDKDSEIDAIVTLHNTAQDFEFSPLNKKLEATAPKIELFSRRNLRVPAKSSKSLSFIVTPKRVGPITIKAVATAQLASDTVEGTLLVEHTGATEFVNHGFLFDMNSNLQMLRNVTINVPKNAIPDSTKIEVSVVGDLVSSFAGNVEQLIQLPTGSGEQIMVQFLPNIMVLRYLKRMNQLTSIIEKRALKFLDLGYQSLLYYRHANGGFSAFGLEEKHASTWLTSYVAQALRQASAYIQVDEQVVAGALEFIVNHQEINGAFSENGDVFEMFNDNDLSLTAFATLALIENMNVYPQYKNNINKALDSLVRGLDGTNDLHALALGTYVLSRANQASKAAFIQRLDGMAINGNGQKWWNKTAPAAENASPWYNHSRTVNIEISAYAALALLENDLTYDALPVIRWLVDQRNPLGGFVASQDTVVGLHALMSFSERFSHEKNNVQIGFQYGQGAETILNVNAFNTYAMQTVELPYNIKNVSVTARGSGLALAQIKYKYNSNVTSAWPRFVLDPTVNRNSHADYLHLSACASFVPIEGAANRSNMAVMEVYLPSGFVVDIDTLPTLESSERIKKVETTRKNTVIIMYFDYLDRREVCPTLHAYKVVKVTNHQLVPVVMYDYYDNVKRARQFYRAPKSYICDICEDSQCGAFCEKAEMRAGRSEVNRDISEGRSSKEILASSLFSTFSLVMLACLLNRR